MDILPGIFESDDVEFEIVNAFCFSKEAVYMLVEARSDEDGTAGSALLKVKLTEKPDYEVLLETDNRSLDYHAEHPELHYILEAGGFMRTLENGEASFREFPARVLFSGLARIDQRSVALFGERGTAFSFDNTTYQQIEIPTDERIYAMHFPSPENGFAGGNYGSLLQGGRAGFVPVELGSHEFIKALHVKKDGNVLLGCDEGVGLVYSNGELVEVEGNSADFYSVNVFQGVEYWGDDDFGVYTRENSRFIPKFETGFAFKINTTDDLMTINAGYDVYIFDGSDWIRLTINPDIERMIERVELDFEPQ